MATNKHKQPAPAGAAPLQQAMLHHRAGRLDQAEALYLRHPGNAEALYLLGLLYQEQGKQAEAIDALSRAIELAPKYEACYLAVDQSLRAVGHLSDVPACYRQLLQHLPASVAGQLHLGHAYRDAGSLQDALASYLAVLAIAPDNAQAYASLGGTLKAMEQFDEAETCYLKALQIEPRFAEVDINLGTLYQHLGKLEQAETHLRRAVAHAPGMAEAHYNLGVLLQALEQPEAALDSYRRAVALKPDFSAPYNNMGMLLRSLERLDEAEQAYLAALAIDANFTEALNNLGAVRTDLKQFDAAIAHFERALTLRPDYAEAYFNMGLAYSVSFGQQEALVCFHNAIHLKPDYAEAYSMLARTYSKLSEHTQALLWCRKTLELWPDSAAAHYNLGVAFGNMQRLDEAASALREAISRRPGFFDAYNNLGVTYTQQGKLRDAAEQFKLAIALRPNFAEAYSNLGSVLKDQGEADESRRQYERAIALAPDYAPAHHNLLLSMQYAANITAEDLFQMHVRFGAQFEPPLAALRSPHDNAAEPGKRLKIGYVSPDFRKHAVSYFMEPLLARHDKSVVEVYCYYNYTVEDPVTLRLKAHADHWVRCSALSDLQLAERIRADGIDLLIDLAGHTAGNRLMVFGRKPAPVQLSYLGYPDTTGLEAMDYRLTDAYLEPPGLTERYNVEQLWRLPEIFCCYAPHANSPDVIDHPPMEDNGYVTFGCFNNYAKVSDPAVRLWAAILKQVPGSKLMLEILGLDEPGRRDVVEQRFAGLGIPVDRLILIANDRKNQYVLYNRIDIALDPFPCNGGTTSYDTLWMGVPFVTRAGSNFISRLGVSILSNAGLQELVAANEQEYVETAVALAADPVRLKRMRSGLRQRFAAGPAMDMDRYVRHLEQAYRDMWAIWCARADTAESVS